MKSLVKTFQALCLFILFSAVELHSEAKEIRPPLSGYLKQIYTRAEKISSFNFIEFLEKDKIHVNNLTYKELLNETIILQKLFLFYRNDYVLVKGKKVMLYDTNITFKLVLSKNAFRSRMNRLLDFENEIYKKHETRYDYFSIHTFVETAILYEGGKTVPERMFVDPNIVINAIQDLKYPEKLTQDVRVYLSPFLDSRTNGTYTPSKEIIVFHPHPSWKVGPTTVAHEFGHAVHRRMLPARHKNRWNSLWKKYWKLRKIDPIPGQKGYDDMYETIAEDLRILYGGSARATIKRKNPGMFGDIREIHKNKYKKLKKMFDKIISGYDENLNYYRHRRDFVFLNVLPGWVFKRNEPKKIKFNIPSDCKYDYKLHIIKYLYKDDERNYLEYNFVLPEKYGVGYHTADLDSIKDIKKNGAMSPGRYSINVSCVKKKGGKYNVVNGYGFYLIVVDENSNIFWSP
ncbi:MAG: hypothetical protein OEZ34_07195 [Spirochaetia bacterium]|nr:hypothetical protein [Spirochaetia bacterium]